MSGSTLVLVLVMAVAVGYTAGYFAAWWRADREHEQEIARLRERLGLDR